MCELFKGTSFDEYKKYLLDYVLIKDSTIEVLYRDLDRERIDIDTLLNDDSLSKREFVELIASLRRVGYNPTIGGGNKAAEDETDRLYAKNPWKFVDEFLQNADDCEYENVPKVDIIVDENESAVEFIYNEKGFSKKDIWAITAFSQSTKIDDFVEYQPDKGIFYKEKTGKKGKGFKSVFSLNADNIIVHIRSNGYCFKLDNKIGRILPVWEEDTSRMDGKTHVLVKFINPAFDLKEIYPEFKALFCVDNCEVIFAKSPFIFMHRIKGIHVKRLFANNTDEFWIEYIEDKEKTLYQNKIEINPQKTILAGIIKHGQYYEEQFQEGFIKIKLNSEIKPDIHVVRYTRMIEDEKAYRNYSIMAPILKDKDGFIYEEGSLFRTFPMSLHSFNMPIAIDAPFELNPDRSGIQYRDEKTNTINSSDWNSIVSKNIFESNGVYESFMLWIRSISDIRIDKYICNEDIVLFDDRSNRNSKEENWVAEVNISALSKKIPIFRLYADENNYVCYETAKFANKDLFLWPCLDALFSELYGEDYKEHIISKLYSDSSLFSNTPIDKKKIANSINIYLNKVEKVISKDSQEMFTFVNKSLYPFLESNYSSILSADSNAFKKMKIYFSRLQRGNDTIIIRESCNIGTKWISDSKKHTSINDFRVIETSPVDMSIISKINKFLYVRKIEEYFAPDKINKTAKYCNNWKEAYRLIEAACHFGADISELYFRCLNNYVLSENYDDEYNAFRIAGVKQVIPNEYIVALSKYSNSEFEIAEKVKNMGVKPPKEYFEKVVDNYLRFRKDTLELLSSNIDLSAVLKDIKLIQKGSNKKINVTYSEIKKCNKTALSIFLNKKIDLFSIETYSIICDELQKEEEYWNQEDVITTEILIRACAGSTKPLSHKDERIIKINIDEVLIRHLEYLIENIVSKNKIGKLTVLPSKSFIEIPREDIQALLGILNPDKQQEEALYYKGNLGIRGSKIQYLKDGKGEHVYLNCNKDGDYKKALEECLNKSFDPETFKAIDEIQHQYQYVKEDIHEINKNVGYDWNRTYEEIENRFENYNKQEIISILTYLRYQGFAKAFGNGNFNSEKEIEDDYNKFPWKFVYEFIQNVDDCNFSEETPKLDIKIDNKSNAIFFEYNENGFTVEDIKALTMFGASRKPDFLDDENKTDGIFNREKTGRKGRGFKSVFSLPGRGIVVHICSNGFSFKFVKRLGSIIPIWEDIKDIPSVGTRIIVEGFDSKYLPNLTDNIKKMFSISDMSSFYSKCPVLHLRKINKITVNNCGEEFSIELKTKTLENLYSSDNFEPESNEIIAGIIKDGKYKKSLWEKVSVSVRDNQNLMNFESVRFTGMFTNNGKTGIATIFAPIINKSLKIEFNKGALYRTLPLNDNVFKLPLSINAPFETNSGRSAVDDISSTNEGILNYVFNELIKDFFIHLRKIEDISIYKYIPKQSLSLFEGYKKLKKVNLLDIISELPILKSYIGEEFVPCIKAKILSSECYKWTSPDILAECFSDSERTLVKEDYAAVGLNSKGLGSKGVIRIDFNNDHFVENLNKYLARIESDSESLIALLKDSIYPYLNNNYNIIINKYKFEDRKKELRNMSVLVFETAKGNYVRESLQTDLVWMTKVPESFASYGKYRNIDRSSISEIYDNSHWIKELHPRIVSFDEAFSSTNLNGSEIKDWDKAAELIKTILYYNIDKKPNIPYLETCVLSEEYDTEENFFRTGFLSTDNNCIIKHIINKDNLIDFAEITGETTEKGIIELARVIKSMGLKKADDFFKELDRGLYVLNSSTLALLESYCNNRETCSKVVSAIKNAFRIKKSDNEKIQLRIVYEDIEKCNYIVIAKILEYDVVEGEVKKALAKEFCEKIVNESSMDYIEAFFRALAVIEKSQIKKEVSISLKDIIDRGLGECILTCKLKNLENIRICINTDNEIEDYPSEAIDKALQWLDEDSNARATYKYYKGKIRDAFPQKKEGIFLFDDEKVILDADDDENSMIRFVQKRYKDKDDNFRSLVNIITQQNSLKGKWTGTKEEYIKKLKKFREETWKQKKVLLPNYEEYINNANGQSDEYVIPELLQNINDCVRAKGQTTKTLDVNINVNDGTMILKYDEAGFDYKNVYSITAVGQSSKHDKSEGEKGLGFKKVFTMFSEVEIYSNGFCFNLTEDKNTVPMWIDSKEKREKYLTEGKTVMVFTIQQRFKNKLTDLLEEWKSIMNGEYVGRKVSPLFLSDIDYINVEGCENKYSRSKMENEFIFKRTQILPLYKKMLSESANEYEDVKEKLEQILEKLKQRRKCQLMNDDEIEDYLDSLKFELALPKKERTKHRDKGCFYSTLPTEINIKVPMFMNIPLELTTGRDGKIENSIYNDTIMKMIFEPLGKANKSIFTILLEEVAKEHQEIFMTDYFTGDFPILLDEISNHNEKSAESIKFSLNEAKLFVGYKTSDMVSLSNSFSINKVVCQYLMNVDDIKNDIFEWIKKHSENVANYYLILPQRDKDCEALEDFANDVGKGRYFPLEDTEDLSLLYLKEELGYVGENESNE